MMSSKARLSVRVDTYHIERAAVQDSPQADIHNRRLPLDQFVQLSVAPFCYACRRGYDSMRTVSPIGVAHKSKVEEAFHEDTSDCRYGGFGSDSRHLDTDAG